MREGERHRLISWTRYRLAISRVCIALQCDDALWREGEGWVKVLLRQTILKDAEGDKTSNGP
jgi:hypothetical protein